MIKWLYNLSIYVMIAIVGYWLNKIAQIEEYWWYVFLIADGVFYFCRRCDEDKS